MGKSDILQKLYSLYFERYLGIRTTGYAAPTAEHAVHYTPLPYRAIRQILEKMSLGAGDVFVDIGCGKGRVVCCACRLPVRKVLGIEINPDLVKTAVANAIKVRGKKAEVEILSVSADDYEYSDATAIYLYNPFGRPVMDKVFAKIEASFRKRPRLIQIAYANPVHEESLLQNNWLIKCEEWPANRFPGFGCPISFWKSISG